MMRSWIPLSLFCLIISSIIGCGDPNGRQPISGIVTFQGKPLDQGVIEFSSSATKTGAPVINGKYAVPADSGLEPGVYKVSISAGDGRTPVDSVDGMPGPTGANIVSKEKIPAEYNTKSKQEVTVTSTKSNKFDFTIP